MAKAAKRIADFILEDPARIVKMSVTELSDATESSEGSIINFAKALGLTGFQQLKLTLAQETVQPVQYIHEDLDRTDGVITATQKIFHSGKVSTSTTGLRRQRTPRPRLAWHHGMAQNSGLIQSLTRESR
jgi:DNA-binding MurR/RpiR family transcriptional regulator